MTKAVSIDPLTARACRDPAGIENGGAHAALEHAANENVPALVGVAEGPDERDVPLVELRVVGDGRAFIRALARAIVRRELIAAGLIAAPDPCASHRRAG